MARILIGISSWADKGLVNSKFYPADVKTPAERLRYYSRKFSVSEIDSSYHHFLTRREIDYWLDNVPDAFVFDVKAFSLFTQHPTPFSSLPRTLREEFGSEIKAQGNIYWHHLPEKAVNSLWSGFAASVEALRAVGKLGTIMFQFPPWFHPGDQSFEYISHVKEMLPRLQIAVEFRFESWLNEQNLENTLRFLKEKEIALVCVDEPQGFRSSMVPLAKVTSRLGIVRFHGRNAMGWESKTAGTDEKFRYLYNSGELSEWLPKIRQMAKECEELHIIFKNKYADFPVKNAKQLYRLLGSENATLVL